MLFDAWKHFGKHALASIGQGRVRRLLIDGRGDGPGLRPGLGEVDHHSSLHLERGLAMM
jgi:hypothetical protein